MQTVNVRAYDSRGGFQNWDPDLLVANADVPLHDMEMGEMRKIIVGFTNRAQVHVTLTGGQQGFIKLSGTPIEPRTSMVNVNGTGVAHSTWTVNTPDGAVYIWSPHGGHGLIVDVVEIA
jgi:hypothetical protein